MTLRSQIVDLIGLDLLYDLNEAARIREVAVVQHQVTPSRKRLLVDVVNPVVSNDEARRLSPWTSYPFDRRSSAREAPSCPVIPVIRAFFTMTLIIAPG